MGGLEMGMVVMDEGIPVKHYIVIYFYKMDGEMYLKKNFATVSKLKVARVFLEGKQHSGYNAGYIFMRCGVGKLLGVLVLRSWRVWIFKKFGSGVLK